MYQLPFQLPPEVLDIDMAVERLSVLVSEESYMVNIIEITDIINGWDWASTTFSPYLKANQNRKLFDVVKLSRLFKSQGEDEPTVHVIELINGFSNTEMLQIYVDRVEEATRKLNADEIIHLLEYIKDEYSDNSVETNSGVDGLKDILAIKLGMLSIPAPIPIHMIINSKVNLPPQELKSSDYNLVRGMANGIIQDIRKIDPATVYKISMDDEVFRVHGPINAFPGEDFKVLDHNTKFGGARMFLDVTYAPDYDQTLTNWFTGSCKYCNRRIMYYRAAVRKPVYEGGWKDCYCSWICVHDDLVNNALPKIALDYAVRDLELSLTKQFAKQCEDVGIYSNISDEENIYANGVSYGGACLMPNFIPRPEVDLIGTEHVDVKLSPRDAYINQEAPLTCNLQLENYDYAHPLTSDLKDMIYQPKM